MKTSTKRLAQAERATTEQAALARAYGNRVGGGKTDEMRGSHEQYRYGRGHRHMSAWLKDRAIEFAARMGRAYGEAAVVTAARWTQRAKPNLTRRAPRIVRLIALRSAIQRQIDNELQT